MNAYVRRTDIPDDLQSALETYKSNYALYKVTGNTSYKTLYENSLAAANQAIASSTAVATANETYIQGFLSSYANTNKDIDDLHKQSQDVQTQGPALQDKLAQSQQLHSHTVAVADETSLYVKASIVFGLLIIVGIVGVF
jgi:hypothetical protein